MKQITVRFFALLTVLSLLMLCACGETSGSPTSGGDGESFFEYVTNSDGTVTLTKYTGSEENLTTPEKIGGKTVTSIGESCFAGNIKLKKVHVSEGVLSLSDYAFECCSVLEKVYLPETLETIGNGAFSGCCKLYLLDIQDGVKSVGDGAFLECTQLVSFIAPSSLETVGDFAFANCTGLVKADMKQSSLTAVSARMFYACSDLSAVRLPEGIKSVGKRAFSNNKELKYIYLPDSVKTVEPYAFEYCGNLQNFTVTANEVAPYTFIGCTSLGYVNFPETLTSVREYAFSLTGLNPDELYIPSGAVISENAFSDPESGKSDTPSGEFEEVPEDSGSAQKAPDTTVAELEKTAAESGYLTVSNEDFLAWSEKYLAFNEGNALLDMELNPYISKYKGEIGYYYVPMTAVASGTQSEIDSAKEAFGDDFEAMYAMINHGLKTEISRFRMEDDMLLYTGVYDFQLSAIKKTDKKPTLDELKACIGNTFTDNCLTSTTTDAQVAFGFSDTLFVIYAPAENINALGAVSMDSYMHTPENEILLNSGATYKILGAGVLENTYIDYNGEDQTDARDYVLLQLINE